MLGGGRGEGLGFNEKVMRGSFDGPPVSLEKSDDPEPANEIKVNQAARARATCLSIHNCFSSFLSSCLLSYLPVCFFLLIRSRVSSTRTQKVGVTRLVVAPVLIGCWWPRAPGRLRTSHSGGVSHPLAALANSSLKRPGDSC